MSVKINLFYLLMFLNLHFVLYFLQFFYCNPLLFKAFLHTEKNACKG